jgi:hypothetical protein
MVRVLAVISTFPWIIGGPAHAETLAPWHTPPSAFLATQLSEAFAPLNARAHSDIVHRGSRPHLAAPAPAPKRRYFRSTLTMPLTGDPARIKVSGLRWRMETDRLQLDGRLTDLKVSARYKIPW